MINKQGYSTTFGDNQCKIMKGSLVVEKGKYYQTLYHLASDAVISYVATTNLGNALDVVILWHQWLGHMSENGLKIIHDQGMFFEFKSCGLNLCGNYIFGKKKRVWFTPSSSDSSDILHKYLKKSK